MGMFINQQESRSELQERIAAELKAKAEQKSKLESAPKDRDEIEDSAYVQGYKRTTTLAPVWLLIFFAVVLLFIYFITQTGK